MTKTYSKNNRSHTDSHWTIFTAIIDHAWAWVQIFCNAIGRDAGAIGTKDVGLGNKMENRNIPEYEMGKDDVKVDDSTDMEDAGARADRRTSKESK